MVKVRVGSGKLPAELAPVSTKVLVELATLYTPTWLAKAVTMEAAMAACVAGAVDLMSPLSTV